MIKETSLEALKARLNIVDTISDYVELKKAGVNYKAPCPFHDEKSASFVVSPAKQICHCFGCGFSADSIKFVQEYKKLSFIEAVEDLANNMNFTLEYDNSTSQKKDYSSIMEYMNREYMQGLTEDTHNYLIQRGVSDESIKAFEIGYAPSSDIQIQSINQQLFSLQEAMECGVLAMDESSSKTYARLTKRISFPIRNHTGKLIGFGGRILEGDTRSGKYINSPQTALFDKSRNLYGYNLAKEHIHKIGTITITEGYLDVVMFHQAGIKTTVATMGTALTELHCNLIKKSGARALLCFDGDKAGVAAAFKASKLLAAHEIYGGVVLFPTGKDPADMVKSGEIDALREIMRKNTPLIKFAINHIAGSYNLAIPNLKQDALKEVSEFLRVLSPLIQDEYKPFVAKVLNINVSHVNTKLEHSVPSTTVARYAHINIPEMNIIKTASESEDMFSIVLDHIDTQMFDFHANEFEMLKRNDPTVQGLLLRDDLQAYNDKELVNQLKIMLISFHSKNLQVILDSTGDYERKMFEMRKVKSIIFKLRREIKNKGRT